MLKFTNRKLKTIVLCAVLEAGALCGVPMRPEEIEKALKLNQNAAVRVIESESPDSPPPEWLLPELPEE